LVQRRFGQELLDAIERGTAGPEHPPLERKQPTGNGRRRLDRRGESRLEELKRWRAKRASELDLDPGVFCPNASLEELAAALPRSPEEMRGLAAIKPWWIEQFGAEVLRVLHDAEARAPVDEAPQPARTPDAPVAEPVASEEQPARKRSRRGRRGSRGGRRRS
jgi:ribonuclease D